MSRDNSPTERLLELEPVASTNERCHMTSNVLEQVTVIVVTFNSAHCLPTLKPLLNSCAHVIISDNGSDDETAAQAMQLVPHAQVLAHEINLGFGAANNRALALVKTPFALLLNPDCEMTVQALHNLLQTAHTFEDAAMVAPQLVLANGKSELSYRWPTPYWKSRGGPADAPACVGFVCGAVMLLRMARMRQVGFFDEAFFLYYEDEDLCLRIFQAQLAIVLNPSVRVLHRARGSVRGKSPLRSEYLRGYHHAQSKLTFLNKHVSTQAAIKQRTRLIISTALALPLRCILFSPRLVARMWGRWCGVLVFKLS